MELNQLFQTAVKKGASDIHLVANKPPFVRIDGELLEIAKSQVLTSAEIESLALSLLSKKQREIFLERKDLDLSYEIPGLSRFRINLHREKNNVGLVARLIPTKMPTMEDILMPEISYQLARLKQGLIIVTGPTGCGKSTTLAAMINFINQERQCHIVTLEDPIEFIFPLHKSIIKQRQLHSDMISFGSGLKHVLRQDPNVIMVGEMRDLETIAATITLAETGHLVLTTLHTYSAAQTIDRIIDIFPPYQQNQIRLQLSLTLAGIISQRLVPKRNGGRIAAREILTNTPAVSNLIRENKIAQIRTVIQTSADHGMVSMDQDLKRLNNEGLIDQETAKSHMETSELLK